MSVVYTPTINKIYKMTEFDLLRTKVTMGNMYMCVDTQKLYYDGGNTADSRNIYKYISIRTVNELFYQITPAYGKTYYCWEDNSLWVWLNKWQSLYSETTYPSAYVYDDIPSNSNPQGLNSIYRYDMPNMPADDNGLLKDGSVIVRDRNRIIKGKIAVDDETNNLLISSFLGGGIRFLPNGKMSGDGEFYIDSKLNLETEEQEVFATLRAPLSILNNEMYIDYSERPELDDNKYPNKSHIYKLYHEGNLNINNSDTITPIQVYNLLIDEDDIGGLPSEFDFNVARLNGHTSDYFATKTHRHNAEDVDGLYSLVQQQAGIATRTIFNNMSGTGISGQYDTTLEILSLVVDSFQLSLSGGATGRAQVNALTDTVIEVSVDPDKHQHTNYEEKLNSLQTQINAVNLDVNTTYTRDVIDKKIADITPTSTPIVGKPLLVNENRILPATSSQAKQLDHNITLNLVGAVTGTAIFNGSQESVNLNTYLDVSDIDMSEIYDSRNFVRTIGDGTHTSYVLVHNLNSENLIVQFRDTITKEQVYLSNKTIDENTIQVDSNVALLQGQIIVTIYKVA